MRDEAPGLPENDRQGEYQTDDCGDLQRDREPLSGVQDDRLVVRNDAVRVVEDGVQWVEQQPDEEPVEDECDGRSNDPRGHHPDEDASQLLQVLDDRHPPFVVASHSLHLTCPRSARACAARQPETDGWCVVASAGTATDSAGCTGAGAGAAAATACTTGAGCAGAEVVVVPITAS